MARAVAFPVLKLQNFELAALGGLRSLRHPFRRTVR